MDFTGERYISGYDSPLLAYEHWHRYLYASQFVKDKKVLDIACGEGYGADLLAQNAKEVIGVDIDPDAISYAKENYKSGRLQFLTGNITNIPIKEDAVFDVIISFETIEHVGIDEQDRFLTEVKRLLKPNGVFICSTPNRALYTDLPDHDNEFHVREFYKEEFERFLSKYFARLKLLGQRVITSSNIWEDNVGNDKFIEFKLVYDKGKVSITDKSKDILYFLAVCSNESLPELKYSVLNDLSDKVVRGLQTRVLELQREVEKLGKWGRELDGEISKKDRRIRQLQEEVEELGRHGEGLGMEIDVRANRILQLQNEVEELSTWGKSLKNQLTTKDKTILNLTERTEKEHHEVEVLIEKLTEMNELLKHKSQTIDEFSSTIKQKEDLVEQKENLIADVCGSYSYKLGKFLTYPVRKMIPVDSKREIMFKITRKILSNPKKYLKKVGLKDIRRFTKALYRENPSSISDNVLKYLDQELPEILNGQILCQEVDENTILEFKKTKNPLVSIIIPVFNQWEFTHRCLYAILNNTVDVSYEVIIADDNSADRTKVILDYVKNVNIVRNDKNLGFVKNCNNAAKHARGTYIVFLNNDTFVQKNWLKSLLFVIGNHEKVALVGSKLVYPDGRLQEAGGIIWKDGTGWNYGHLDDASKPEYNYVKEVDYVSGASILIKKDIWNQLGGFNEKFAPAYFEDVDLAFRIRKMGYKVTYQPKSMVVHFEGVSNGKNEKKGIKKFQTKNREKFVKEWKYILKKEHFINGKDVFWTRDRSQKKKTILVIDHYVPHFDKDAGSKCVYNYLKLFVNKGYNVKFFGDNYLKCGFYGDQLESMGIELLTGPIDFYKWFKDNAKYIDFVYGNRPHIFSKYVDFIKQNSKAKIIYFGHDLHYLRKRRRYELDGDKIALKISEEMKKIEFDIFEKADVVCTVSEFEKDVIKKEFPNKEVFVIPIFVYREFLENINDFNSRKDLLFVGGFAHLPNIDGIKWFLKEVFPFVKAKNSNIKCTVVGANAPVELLNMRSDTVKIIDWVSESDLMSLYDNSRIAIVPLRYGAGVKGKVVEAMARGVPLVSTSIGLEGLRDINDVMLAYDDPRGFADAILELYGDSDLWREMSAKNFDYCKKYFSYQNALEVVQKIFKTT